MNLEIKKIRLNELEDFVNSKTFHEFEYLPISDIRSKSYLANPHALPDDFVVYLGFFENKLVAFRSLLPDIIQTDYQTIRFAWCSGAWVHPDFRRKSFSKKLLKEAYTDWDKKLMFTNYIPNSEKLIVETGWFKPIHQFNGVRAYLFPKTRKLLPNANANILFKIIFSLIDWVISIYSSIRLFLFTEKIISSVTFKTLDFPDQQCYQSLKESQSVFSRGALELKWIFDNPWISSQKSKANSKYPFSSFSNSFIYKTIKVYSENGFVGFFLFSVREGHLKTLYWQLPDGFEKEITAYLKHFCKKNKVEMTTVYKKEIAEQLFKRKFPFLHLKKYGQKIYSTFEIQNNSEIKFQDGDGDVIFT